MGSIAQLGSALVLWHDYRSGHSLNLSGSGSIGVEAGALGCFRTGYGFETVHDFTAGVELSLGYIRVSDHPLYTPPADGLCIIASYLQSSAAVAAQIIGQGGNAVGNISWQLMRSSTHIIFKTSDGVATASFSYKLDAVPGQIETVVVRYTGGAGPGNCTIAVLAPTPSSANGQIDRVPQNVAQPISICCCSTSAEIPFFGTMRYVAYIRGKQASMTVITDLAAEIEAIQWPTAISECDTSGSVADRAVQYAARFGADASIANEGGVVGARLSNSEWVFGNAAGAANGTWRLAPMRTQHLASSGSPADVSKALTCMVAGQLKLPLEYFGASVTQALAAYGTWDFWVYHAAAAVQDTYVIYDANGVNDDGYAVRVDATDISLIVINAGVVTVLITDANVLGAGAEFIHLRVTRTGADAWKLYYQICDAAGVPGRWVYAGTANDGSIATSEGMFLDYDADGCLLLGNHRSEKSLFKWRGVVNPV